METTQSMNKRPDFHSSTSVDVPTSKSKYGSHSSLTSTNSASSLSTPDQHGHQKSHPLLSSRISASDSRLSKSFDNAKNPNRSSKSKNRLHRLDLSLDSNAAGHQHGRHDPNSTTESTEDEARTSADEYSTEDDAENSLGPGGRDREGRNIEPPPSASQSLSCSLNSSSSYVDKAVEELITTERTYVKDLHDVIQGYMQHVAQIADTVAGKVTSQDYTLLFGNIQSLYEFNREFLNLLEKQGRDAVAVAQCFLDQQQDFIIYSDYCTNFPQSVEVLERWAKDPILLNMLQRQQMVLGHSLPLGTYLCKPVQRILKYHLLLKNIQNYHAPDADGYEVIEEASETMIDVAMRINEIKRQHERWLRAQEVHNTLTLTGDQRVDVVELGDLVLEDVFRVIGNWGERHVFLFRKAFIISKKRKDGFLQVKVIIKTSNLMLIESISREPLQFHVLPFDAPKVRHALQAKSMEQKKIWCQEIKKLMIESCEQCIPDRAKELVLGTRNNDVRLPERSRNNNKAVSPASRMQKNQHAERQDDGFQKVPSKTMTERRTRRRSTGAIKNKALSRQTSTNGLNDEVVQSNSVEDTVVGTEEDADTSDLAATKQRSVSPSGPQNLGTSESDVEVSLYRPDRKHPSDRLSSSKSRRSQSLDDVRNDDSTDDTVATGSGKIYSDDVSMDGNGDDDNFTADNGDAETRLGNSSSAEDDRENAGISDGGTQSIRIIPVVRAESFKEAMRSTELNEPQPDYSRTMSQPPPTAARDSRSSWVMPVFPSLEEVFNEWFTSAMARTGSLGSSSSNSPCRRTQSDASTSSVAIEGHDVKVGWPSQSSTSDQSSPHITPEFRTTRLGKLFNWEPTHLGPISGSSDSLDSSDLADDWMNSRTGFSTKSRLPPGFETGLFDRDFGFRPSLFSNISQSISEPHFSRHIFNSETHSTSGNRASGDSKVTRTNSESSKLKSGSASRVIPVKVVAGRSASDGESGKPGSRSTAASSNVTGGQHAVRSKAGNVAVDECDSVPDSKHKTVSPSKHSSQFTEPTAHLPAGFFTGFDATSIPNTTRSSKVDKSSDVDSRSVKIVSVSESGDEREVRVIPVSHEQNAASCEAPTRKQRTTRGRVIPVVVQSSFTGESAANADDGARTSTNPTRSPTSSVSVPVTVVQSGGVAASNSSGVSKLDQHPVSDRNYLPLCYDDEDEETVKRILQEMTVKRLPIRDTVRLLNMKTSRSMDFGDSKRHGVCQESPSSIDRDTTVATPTADLLPAGFWVGNSMGTVPRDSPAQPSATGDLVRKRLHLFDGGASN